MTFSRIAEFVALLIVGAVCVHVVGDVVAHAALAPVVEVARLLAGGR